MRQEDAHQAIVLADYQPVPYEVESLELEFDLGLKETKVVAKSHLKLKEGFEVGAKVDFNGVSLELESVKLDDVPVEYSIDNHHLFLRPDKKEFTLTITNTILPSQNTALEGLYESSGILVTQCEAQGFRRITYFYDRPDVMTTYRTRVVGDIKAFPVLLANGNLVNSGKLESGRHFAEFEDPFKKPSYLFALVAGDLEVIEDIFTTTSGRKVALGIYAVATDIGKCEFAMESLKHSMAWDEKVYNLECDLDHYKIVAIGDFNAGAMENKGLNVFNNAAVLAGKTSTEDETFKHIEAVVGHEYFHNWTGNRVTCRDWFQLCLKEGLTVFREQQFTAAMGSPSLARIRDVIFLRDRQFNEDSGPTAHPVRPDKVIRFDNLYTVTVYEKGAELIRMLAIWIGEKAYYEGIKRYFTSYDGMAVTIEDFLDSFKEVTDKPIDLFARWYFQSGTPRVTMKRDYDESNQKLTIHLEQVTPPTADQSKKTSLVIPVKLGLIDSAGKALSMIIEGKDLGNETVLTLSEARKSFVLEGVPAKSVPSLFRDFSAPVLFVDDYSDDELLHLSKFDANEVNRWESLQKLIKRSICDVASGKSTDERLIHALVEVVTNEDLDPGFRAFAVLPPSLTTLFSEFENFSLAILKKSRDQLIADFAKSAKQQLTTIYKKHHVVEGTDDLSPKVVGRRALKNLALNLLLQADPGDDELAVSQMRAALCMSDEMSALKGMLTVKSNSYAASLSEFEAKWKSDSLVMDNWFKVQALDENPNAISVVEKLTKHPDFLMSNPNRVRSLLVMFCRFNPYGFFSGGERAFDFCLDKLHALDRLNPYVASALAESFNLWRRMDPETQEMIEGKLHAFVESHKLSPNVYEKLKKTLSDRQTKSE